MIDGKFKRINMGFNYKMAEDIVNTFNQDDITERIDAITNISATDADNLFAEIFSNNQAYLNPQKYTLLHEFIEHYIYYYLLHKRWFVLDELCDDMGSIDSIIDELDEIDKALKEHGFENTSYLNSKNDILFYDTNYDELAGEIDEDDIYVNFKDIVRETFDSMFGCFEKIENDLIEAIFFLLYSNKGFLFQFNKYLSAYINTKYLPAEAFDEYYHIIRSDYLPQWLKRAVFYRDNGRCQHCGTDLSGLLMISENRGIQYDHIIPLEKGGTNDATNFQLLCADCNLHKSGNIVLPKYFYQMYW